MNDKVAQVSYPNLWIGSLWKILASASFALISGIVRYLSKGTETLPALPVNQIIFLENIVGLLLMLPFLFRLGFKNLKTTEPMMNLLRLFLATAGIICWYFSLKHMQIGYASALAFMGPIFTVMGGFILLKERLTPLKNGAIFISFIGAFLIMRPDQAFSAHQSSLISEIGVYSMLPLLSAFFIAGSKLATRKLAHKGESTKLMTLYLMFVLVPATFFPALLHWVTPTFYQLILCFILGILVLVAHYSTSQAFKYAEINFLTPFSFLRLILGILIGYILFSELPTQPSVWMGMGVILFSIALLSLKEKNDAR